MKKLIISAAAAGLLAAAAVPASAQFYAGADPNGVGVQVGPLGIGVGPGYGWRGAYGDRYAYGGDCRVIRERTLTPDGRAIFTTRRICD
jgi:hypothetical protein